MYKTLKDNIHSTNFFEYLLFLYILLIPIQIELIKIDYLRGLQYSDSLIIIMLLISIKKILYNGFYKILSKADIVILLIFFSATLSLIFGSKYYFSVSDFFASAYFLIFY